MSVVCFPVNAENGRSEPKKKRLASFNTRGKTIGPCCLSHMEGKINYGHYWRCFNMANDHQRGRCKWCINPRDAANVISPLIEPELVLSTQIID